jgi:type IV secretory pathway VirD2 relaxase
MQVFVKHLGYKSHKGGKASGGVKAIKGHIKYIENRADELGQRVDREMFNKNGETSRHEFYKIMSEQKQQGVIAHKLVISMDRKDFEAQKIDLKELAKETMASWEQKTGRQFNWIAAVHDKASNPHVHIVVSGRDQAGKEVTFMPNQLEQLKRVSDKERGRLATRNIERSQIPELMRDFNPMKQISKEKSLTKGLEKILDKAVMKALDKTLDMMIPGMGIAKSITRTITRGFDLGR